MNGGRAPTGACERVGKDVKITQTMLNHHAHTTPKTRSMNDIEAWKGMEVNIIYWTVGQRLATKLMYTVVSE